MKRNLTRNQKTILSVVIVLAFLILLFYYGFMIYHKFAEENFVNQSIQISDANQNPVFKIDKVLLFSSANATDNTEEKSLKDLDINQFTDIAIYINNTSYIQEQTQENTVKALRIDNIEILSDQPTGIKSLTYKNPLNAGNYEVSDAANVYSSTDNRIECAPIDFAVTYKNEENPDYSKPTFYADCSNYISLSYLNRNIISHYAVRDNQNISLSGSLLKQANVDLAALATAVNFRITITNNLDTDFVYNIKLKLSFDENSGITTNGYSFQGRTSSDGRAYDFFKDIN